MAIKGEELKKEKLILKKVNTLLNREIDELKDEVKVSSEDFIEFKKLLWSDSSSFDSGDIIQAKSATDEEMDKIFKKQNYLKRLLKINKKPYFASIVFEDKDKEIFNIYISLTYLKDKQYNNILYDWRSPICSLFYDYEVGSCRYTAPGGEIEGKLLRKRQYIIEDGKLINVFDNSLNISDSVLQEVLSEDTDDKMKNIVNTIQREQNLVIRDLDSKNLIVQGIAGSGKTSVALHRIAFLLYRLKNLSSNNILVFSPNNIFTEYISNVLPELGEDNTLQTTFNDYLSYMINEYENIESFSSYVARYYTYKDTDYDFIKYKQSDEIISDLDNYIDNYINNCKICDDVLEDEVNLMTVEELNELIHYKYNRLPLFERIDEIANKLSENFYKGSRKKSKTFRKLIYENANFSKDYKKIYKEFYLSGYSKYKLTEDRINKFLNKKTLNYEDGLLLTYIKGRLEGFRYEGDIKEVVIDEAQDYSKLQFIIIKNIFKKASFTILGDINQNINPYYSYKSLKEIGAIFGDYNYIELSKTYRSSPEIIEYTNKILNLDHINAIRKSTNKPVVFRKKYNLSTQIVEDINQLKATYKSVAVITKDKDEAEKLYDIVKDSLSIELITEDDSKFSKKCVIIPAYLAKGLEFDSVIVYNNRDNSYKNNERNLLYVATTRAQHELYVYN